VAFKKTKVVRAIKKYLNLRRSMKNKRIKISTLLLVIIVSVGQAQTINIKQKDGALTTYNFGEMKKLTFSAGNLIVNKNDGGIPSFVTSTIRYLSFSSKPSGGVGNVKQVANNFIIYPIPAHNELNVSFISLSSEKPQIDIWGIDGKILYTKILKEGLTQQFTIDLSTLKSGIYFIRLYGDNVTVVKRFIKN
jgi:hypothetical protein